MIQVVSLYTRSLATWECDEEIGKDDVLARWIKTSFRNDSREAVRNVTRALTNLHSMELFEITFARDITASDNIFLNLERAGVKILARPHLDCIFAGEPLLRRLVLQDEKRSPVLVEGQASHRRHCRFAKVRRFMRF